MSQSTDRAFRAFRAFRAARAARAARALVPLIVVGGLTFVGTAAQARPMSSYDGAGVPAVTASGTHGEDFVRTATDESPLGELRRDARRADRRGAPVVHHVYASVVSVTDTTSDDARTTADLTRTKVEAAVRELSDYYLEESGGRIAFDLVGYETRSWHKTDCPRAEGLTRAADLSFDGAATSEAWRKANNHVWALTLEGADVCGGGIAHLPGNVVFQNEGVVDLPGSADDPSANAGIPTMLHEFGHNLGFGHADQGICRSSTQYDAPLSEWADVKETLDSKCPFEEYGDWQDIMGYGNVGQRMHISALQRYLAGWLGDDYASPGLGSTPIRLHALDDASGVRAIALTDPRTDELYVVEYRTNAGNDATSQEFTSPLRDQDLAFYYDYPALPGSQDTFARWVIDTPKETGGVRVLRLLYGTNDVVRHEPEFPYYRESLALAIGTSTYRPDAYNRNAHLDAGESFTSYSGGIQLSADALDPAKGAEIFVTLSRAPSTTSLTVGKTSLTTKQAPQLAVRVAAPTAATVTGSVVAKVDGRAVRTVRLPGSTSAVKFTIPAIKKAGRHTITVSYGGSSQAKTSTSRSVRVTVR